LITQNKDLRSWGCRQPKSLRCVASAKRNVPQPTIAHGSGLFLRKHDFVVPGKRTET